MQRTADCALRGARGVTTSPSPHDHALLTRRDFAGLMMTCATSALLPSSRWRPRQGPLVNGARLNRHLNELSRFGETADGGISRVAYSEADIAGREFALGLMRDAGMDTRVDVAGNLVGWLEGSEQDLAPLMMGSHIDSVPDGGNYDGQVGSMGAIEVAHTLSDLGIQTRHPVEVLIFQNEEGGKTGSRALSGEVESFELELQTASGKTIGEGIGVLGGDADRLTEARRSAGDVAAYLELHIEQGAVLQNDGIQIGVVQGIVGIKRWTVTVEGFANHAGTTPMDARRDALVAAARFIEAVNDVARSTPGRQVATVGRIRVSPGAPNVIPGRVELSLEIRDLEMDKIDSVFSSIRSRGGTIADDTGTTFQFDQFYLSRAALTDVRIQDRIEDAASSLGLTTVRMPSGAGHDAQSIALLAPVGMIFVPSVDGISHSPRELTRPQDITNGANVLLRSLLALDSRDWG